MPRYDIYTSGNKERKVHDMHTFAKCKEEAAMQILQRRYGMTMAPMPAYNFLKDVGGFEFEESK